MAGRRRELRHIGMFIPLTHLFEKYTETYVMTISMYALQRAHTPGQNNILTTLLFLKSEIDDGGLRRMTYRLTGVPSHYVRDYTKLEQLAESMRASTKHYAYTNTNTTAVAAAAVPMTKVRMSKSKPTIDFVSFISLKYLFR